MFRKKDGTENSRHLKPLYGFHFNYMHRVKYILPYDVNMVNIEGITE